MVTPKFWMGLTGVGVLLTTLLIGGKSVAKENEGIINDLLGLSTTKIDKVKTTDTVDGSAYADENGVLSDED